MSASGKPSGKRIHQAWWIVVLLIVFGVAVAPFLFKARAAHRQRNAALDALRGLEGAIRAGSYERMVAHLRVPPSLQGRTYQEQADFIARLLRQELTGEGIRSLAARGRFGPLAEVFPDEASDWAERARVNRDECDAFRLDPAGGTAPRMEVVFLRTDSGYRIIRCNNVLSPDSTVIAETKPLPQP